MSDKRGRIPEHRYIMSEHIGRYLKDNEVVHHLDGNSKHNTITNLELLTRGEHSRLHNIARGITYVTIECTNCGMEKRGSEDILEMEDIFAQGNVYGNIEGIKNRLHPE